MTNVVHLRMKHTFVLNHIYGLNYAKEHLIVPTVIQQVIVNYLLHSYFGYNHVNLLLIHFIYIEIKWCLRN